MRHSRRASSIGSIDTLDIAVMNRTLRASSEICNFNKGSKQCSHASCICLRAIHHHAVAVMSRLQTSDERFELHRDKVAHLAQPTSHDEG